MLNRWTLLIVAAIAAVGVASQASAQSFNPRDGSGNSMPFSYGPGGERTPWTAMPNRPPVAPQVGGKLYDYAAPKGNRSGNHSHS